MRITSKGLLIGIALAFVAWPLLAETEIIVDASKTLGPVNRNVFGHNLSGGDKRGIFAPLKVSLNGIGEVKNGGGYWDPVARKPFPPLVDAVKALGAGMMRYPGGCLAHNYDWRKTVGPLSARDGWSFGLDDYLAVCRTIGAEPMITCSDYVLPSEEMPAHLASLVEYLNAPASVEHPWAMKRKEWGHPEPYGVKWFELGNESGHGNHNCEPRRCFTPEAYAAYAISCAAAMRLVDPTIKIGVLTESKDAFRVADFVIQHPYGPNIDGQDIEANFKSAMAWPEHLEREMRTFHISCEKACGRNLPLALTEYNILYFNDTPVPYRFSAMAGLLCADLTRLFLQPDANVATANFWELVNGPFGLLLTTKDGVKPRGCALPFHQLWGGHFGGDLLVVEVKGAPRFEAPPSGSSPVTSPAARGDAVVACAKTGEVDLGPLTFDALAAAGITANSDGKGALSFKFDGLSKPCYVNFGLFPNKARNSELYYRMSFESRFIPATKDGVATAQLGLSLLDSRGWNASRSAMGVDGVELGRDWTPHNGDFTPRAGCWAINVGFRAPAVSAPLHGTLEVKNFKVETWSAAVEPAYQGLTAASSLSADGKTLHLIVFNKSFDAAIESSIDLKRFIAKSAVSWTAADKPDSIEYKAPVQAEVKLPPPGQAFKLKFPAHSMTAIDFAR